MKLASLAFLAVLLLAHLAGDADAALALPLSMFRDGTYRPFGYVLFLLLLVIAGLMLRRLHRAGLDGSACLLGVVAFFLLLVALTPSDGGFHLFCSFLVLALLFAYYAAVLSEAGVVFLWAHLTVPLLLVLGTSCHSYGLWQKGLVVYFLLAANVQHALLSGGVAPASRQGRRGPGGMRRRVVVVVPPGRTWSRRRAADRRSS
jgi:hypothetical protein